MVEPLPSNTDDPRDGDATLSTGEPDSAPADSEPAHPVSDTRDGDAPSPTGGSEPGPVRNAQATIGEPIDLARDSSAELHRKADKFRARTADPKAKRKTHRKEREKTQAAKPARKDREKPQAMRAARQPDLAAVIRDLNVAWSPPAIETAAAILTNDQKADLRQHLPDLISKLQRLADSIGPRSTDAAVDEASCADQPGLFGSG